MTKKNSTIEKLKKLRGEIEDLGVDTGQVSKGKKISRILPDGGSPTLKSIDISIYIQIRELERLCWAVLEQTEAGVEVAILKKYGSKPTTFIEITKTLKLCWDTANTLANRMASTKKGVDKSGTEIPDFITPQLEEYDIRADTEKQGWDLVSKQMPN
jgi:hypothetical protein